MASEDQNKQLPPPWELHATHINMPRFQYRAASALPRLSVAGFLITCTFDREKSATKEAIDMLQAYLKIAAFWGVQEPKEYHTDALAMDSLVAKGNEDGGLLHDSVRKKSRQAATDFEEGKYVSGCQDLCRSITEPELKDIRNEALVVLSSMTNSSDCPETKESGTAKGTVGVDEEGAVAKDDGQFPQGKEASGLLQERVRKMSKQENIHFEGVKNVSNEQVCSKELESIGKEGVAKEEVTAIGVGVDEEREVSNGSGMDKLDGLLLMKLARKGIVFVFLPDGSSVDPVTIMSKIWQDLETGVRKPPRWCQRILPVQRTCPLTKVCLRTIVVKLVKQHLQDSTPTSNSPLKYAVGFNRRGVEGIRAKDDQKHIEEHELLERMNCIHAVAGAVEEAVTYTVVDLIAPQMVVMVELLPIAGMQESPVCAVAVLPRDMVNLKPKLSVKSLSPTSNPLKKRKGFD